MTRIGRASKKAAPSCLVSGRSAGNMSLSAEAAAAETAAAGRGGEADAEKAGRGGIHGTAREAFFRSRGLKPEQVYSLVQVHSRDVFVIGEDAPSPEVFLRQGDGMVSFSRDVFPAVIIADCLPVFLLDTENGFLAVLHSGWKGTGIVLKALDILKKAGSRPEALAAVLGPCIQGCCYRVDRERALAFDAEFGAAREPADAAFSENAFPLGAPALERDGGFFLSMQAANARLLAGADVRNIAYCTDCTFTDKRLGSFRREGPQFYTRMIAMAGPFCYNSFDG